MDNPESLDVNAGNAETPAGSSPAEQTPTTPVETSAPETGEPSESAPSDASGSESSGEPNVPKSRLDEVIRERNELRTQIQSRAQVQTPSPSAPFPSFNPAVGYPEDPKEYAQWVAQSASVQAQTSVELNEFQSKYSDFVKDPAFVGAVVGLRQSAAAEGKPLSFAQAADIFMRDVAGKYKKEGMDEVRNGEVTKTSAVVSKSQPKSSTVGSNVRKLTAADIAALPKKEQQAKWGQLLAQLQEDS